MFATIEGEDLTTVINCAKHEGYTIFLSAIRRNKIWTIKVKKATD